MMGKDCDRMITSINSIKDAIADAIKSLTKILIDPIESVNGDPIMEQEKPIPDIISGVISAVGKFSGDAGKMKSLGSSIYSSSTNFFNSYGSPWTEINKLQEQIDLLQSVSNSIQYTEQKMSLLAVLNTALAYAVDAKWALSMYHDYIQRGFDSKFNDNNPSITHMRTKNQASIGNIDQDFQENVHIRKESIDPY